MGETTTINGLEEVNCVESPDPVKSVEDSSVTVAAKEQGGEESSEMQPDSAEQKRKAALAALNELGEWGPDEEGFDFADTLQCADDLLVDTEEGKLRSTVKFPLRAKYSFWHDSMKKNATVKNKQKVFDWSSGMTRVAEMRTIQEFWRIFNNISLTLGVIMCFRSDVEPKWEDPHFEKGGRWILNSIAPSDRTEFFTELSVALLTDAFHDECATVGDEILGVSLMIKKKNWRIEIWNSKADPAHIRQVDLKIRRLLGKDENFNVEYKSFDQNLHEVWNTSLPE